MHMLVDQTIAPDDFVINHVPPSRRLVPEIERMIEDNWLKGLAGPSGSRFFDGGLWRYSRYDIREEKIELSVEPTSFRVYKGTNIDHPELFQQYGDSVMANPLVVNATIRTRDGYLVLARRSEWVAVFPRHIHLIGGTIPRKKESLVGQDFFQAIRNEVFEEVAIEASEIDCIKCVGLGMDVRYRTRTIAFTLDTKLSSVELSERVASHADEHDELFFVPTLPGELKRFAIRHENELAAPLHYWINRGVDS